VRAREPRRFLLVAPLVAGFLLQAPARADESPASKLQAVEKALEESRARQAELSSQADALAAELAKLRQDEVAAAQEAQRHEAALTDIEARLAALATEEQTKIAELNRQRADQAGLLMALERLASGPPEGLLLAPGTPVEVLRGAMLMGAAVPPIEHRARDLKVQLDALAALRVDIGHAEDQHHAERAALTAQQARLAVLIARKSALQQNAVRGAEESGQRQQQLAAQAADLRDLINRLDAEARRRAIAQREAERQEAQRQEAAQREAQRQESAGDAAKVARPPDDTVAVVTAPPPVLRDPTKPQHIRPFAEAHGAMVYPVSGLLVRRYGEADDLGVTSKGISLATRPAAQVVAPFDGEVMFAGPFRGYGHILIIGHGDGYHSLLAGLDRVDCGVGQWLVAGEPVGIMPDGADRPRLYFELRHNNQPINPLPWLVTHAEKVNG
jgi:murein hydrolase activator